MKQKVRRISKSAISILLSVMMVVSMFAIGIVAVNAYNYQNTAIIYFDATNWGDQSSNTVYFTLLFNSDSEREIFQMNRISNDSSSRIYYYEMSNYTGTNNTGGSNVVFFSGNSGWANGYESGSNKGLGDIQYWSVQQGGKYSGTKGTDIYNNHIYYFSAASANGGTLTLSKSYDAISDANKINGSTAHNTDSVWSYDLKAISSVANTPTGTPSTSNASSTAGGKVTVNAAYFNGWDHTSGTGDTTASYTTATYSKAAKSTTATYKVTQVFSGYEFDGWYTSATSTGSTNLVSTSTSYSEMVTGARTLYAHFHRANSTVSTAVSPSGAGTAYISSTSTIGTATSVSDIAYGGTVYLKATANNGYTFSNWKTVSGLSYADSSAATTSATVTANATATAEFTANTYTISKTNPAHAKIKVPAEAAYNSSITPAATTDLGYKISKYMYSTDGSTWTDVTPGSSFTMPASNVTVTAEVTTCDTYTVTLNTSGTGSGTVSAKTSAGETVSSGDEVNEGTVVTFTATPANNNAFTGWSGTGSASSISGTDSSKTVTINADTSVTGTFAANLIQLVTYGTSYSSTSTTGTLSAMNLMESTGYYRSANKVTSGGGNSSNAATIFTVKRTIGGTATYAKSGASGDTWWITDSMPAVTPQHWTTDNTLNKKYRDELGSSGTQHYVFYDPETNKIWLSTNADGSTGVKVIAKDGSFVDSSPSSPTTSAGWGDTTLKVSTNGGSSWSNGTSANNGCAQTYTLTNAQVESSTTKIKVSTTVSKTNYYVYGFDINGCITKKATKNGSAYELTFSPEDIETNISNFIEITPIYMRTDPSLTDPDADPTTIRFYVRSFSGEIKSRWGGELYCFSYGGSDSNGAWPGQPMVNLGGGTYYMDLPLGTEAITLSNAAADWIHATTLGVDLTVEDTWKTRNEYQCQSYDYDDFQYIYAKPGVGENDEDIIFDFKYKQGDWGKSGLDNFYNLTTSATQSSFPDTLTPSSYSGWEDYTDLYGEPIDLWGTKLTSNYNNNPVRVVVQGYYDTSAANNSYYATTYVVYKPSATTGSCTYSKVNYTNSSAGYGKKSRSEFLQRTASEMGLTALEGQPVKITYEYAIYKNVSTAGTSDGDNQYAERADGIWYYSETKPVKGNVIIQYADNAHSAFSDDTFEIDEDNPGTDYDGDPYTVNEGTTTHAKAYFVDNNYGRSPRAVARPTDAPLDVDYDYRTVEWAYTDAYDYYDVKAEESPDGEYTFIGWYKKSGNTYELASTDYTYQMEASANETFAARYVKTPAGQVKLAHKPVATNNSGGTGDRKVWYDVVSSLEPNTSLLPSGTTQEANGAITVPKTYVKYGKNYVLKVKFQVDPDTNSLKHGIYSEDEAITANLLNESGLVSHNNNVNVDDFALSPSGTTATLNTDYVTFSIPMDRFFKVVEGTENDPNPEYEFDDNKSLIEVFSDYDRIKNNINITKTVDYDNGDSFTINVKEQYLTDPSDPSSTAWRNYAGKYTVDDGTAETDFTGTISITGGQTIHIVDAPAGTVFQISEAALASSSAYTYDDVTIDGATATNITQGKQFTMPATGSVDMEFTNNFKPVTDTYVAAYRTATTGNFTPGTTGGTVDNDDSVEKTGLPNTSVTAVAAAANTGYTFKGWYSSLDGADEHRLTTNTSYGPNIVGGQTYYALFQINSYSAAAKVVYNDTGSTSSWTEDTDGTVTGVTASVTPTSGTYSTSENFTATVNNTNRKPNYKFVGWYSASGASAVISGSSENGGASLNRTADRTFYALYKRQVKANVTYKVTSDGTFSGTEVSGVTVSGQTMKNGDAAYTAGTYVDVDASTNFTAGTPQYADAGYYEFRGWYKADGTSLGGTYATSAGQSRADDRAFVAVYGPRTYTLTVRVMLTADGTNYTAVDGGKTISATKGSSASAFLSTGATAESGSVNYGDSITFSNGGSTDPRVVGYYNFSDLTASGSNYTLDNGATAVTNPLSITGNANVVLLVQNKYTATAEVLIRNGSTVTDGDDSWASVTPATYYAGDSGNVAFSHTDKTSIGYSFVGWSEGKDSTPEIGTSDPSYAKTASYTRYAIYEPIGYTLTTGIYYGSAATYSASATKDTDGTTTGTTITSGSSYTYSDTAFSPAIAAADATGRTADQQSRYVLKGYQIDGTWYAAGTAANTALAALRKTGNHTVYAYYQEYCKVTVQIRTSPTEDGTYTQQSGTGNTATVGGNDYSNASGVDTFWVVKGSTVTAANKAAAPGYTFKRVSSASQTVNADVTVNADYYSTAFSASAAVSVKLADGTWSHSVSGITATVTPSSYTYSTDALTYTTNCTANGYTFKGWSTTSEPTSLSGLPQTVTGLDQTQSQTTRYAIYEQNTYEPTVYVQIKKPDGTFTTATEGSQAGNTATVAPTSYTYGSAVTFTKGTTASGYSFLGWSTTSGGTIASTANSINVPGNGAVTRYAIFEQLTYDPVVYVQLIDANGDYSTPVIGTVDPENANNILAESEGNAAHAYPTGYTWGQTVTYQTVGLAPGYEFVGWSETASPADTSSLPKGTNGSHHNYNVTGNGVVTRYAIFRQLSYDYRVKVLLKSSGTTYTTTGVSTSVATVAFPGVTAGINVVKTGVTYGTSIPITINQPNTAKYHFDGVYFYDENDEAASSDPTSYTIVASDRIDDYASLESEDYNRTYVVLFSVNTVTDNFMVATKTAGGSSYATSNTNGGTIAMSNASTGVTTGGTTTARTATGPYDGTVTATATAANGYTFKGWYNNLDGADGHKLTATAAYNDTLTGKTVYALFDQDSYAPTVLVQIKKPDGTYTTATPNEQAGNEASASPTSYTYGSTVTFTKDTTASGYIFRGWTTTSGGAIASNADSIDVTGNGAVTRYAIFEQLVTDTFKVATKNVGQTAYSDTNTAGGNITLSNAGTDVTLNPTTATKSGTVTGPSGGTAKANAAAAAHYTFKGWSTSLTGTPATGTYSETIGTTGKTVYALFEQDSFTPTVYVQIKNPDGSFTEATTGNQDGNTATVSPSAYAYGDIVTFTKGTTASGYIFRGWSTTPEPSSYEGTNNTFTLEGNGNVKAYAIFEKLVVDNFKVATKDYGDTSYSTDNTDGGSITLSNAGANVTLNPTTATKSGTVTGPNGGTAKANATAAANYTFKGWSTKLDGTGISPASGTYSETIGTTGKTVYALFEQDSFNATVYVQIKSADNTFTAPTPNSQSGNSATVSPAEYTYGTSVTFAHSNTATGYTFLGWSATPSPADTSSLPTTDQTVTGNDDVEMYAIFQQNGYVARVTTLLSTDGSTYTNPASAIANVNSTVTNSTNSTSATSTTSTESVSIVMGDTLAYTHGTPAAAEYTFKGWYDASGLNVSGSTYTIKSGASTATPVTTAPAGNVEYYALYVKKYNANALIKVGTDASFTLANVSSYTSPEVGQTVSVDPTNYEASTTTNVTATRSGTQSTEQAARYRFIGWYDANGTALGTGASSTQTRAADRTFYAYYREYCKVEVKILTSATENGTYTQTNNTGNTATVGGSNYSNASGVDTFWVAKGSTVTAANYSAAAGYTFKEVTPASQTVNSDTTVSAKYYLTTYTATAAVSIKKTNGDWASDGEITASGLTAGANPISYTYNASAYVNFTHNTQSGYTFKGWSTTKQPDSYDGLVDTLENKTQTQNYVYYAIFEQNGYTASVTTLLSTDGSTYTTPGSAITGVDSTVTNSTTSSTAKSTTSTASVPIVVGDTLSFTRGTPATADYTFVGWYTADDLTNTSGTYTIKSTATVDTPVTEAPAGNVGYYALFVERHNANAYIKVGTDAAFDISKVDDYTSDAVGQTVSVEPTDYDASTENVTATRSGTQTTEQAARYHFIGWYDAAGTALGTGASSTQTRAADRTFYAYYQKYFKVTITDSYSDNNGTDFTDFDTTKSTMTSGTYGTTVKEIYVPTGTKIAVNTGSHTDAQYHIDATSPVRVGSATSTTIFTSNTTEITADTNLYVRYLKDQVRANAQAVFANTTSDTWTTTVPTGFTAPTFTWNDSYTAGTDVNYDSAKTFQPTVSATTLTDSNGNRYVFKGWYLNSQSNPQNNTTDTATAVARTSSPTFYALFTKQVKVTIQVQTDDATPGTFVNDGTTNNNATINGSSTNNNTTVYVDYGATVTASQTPDSAYNAVGIVYSDDTDWTAADTFTADTTIYARFSLAAVDKSLTITKKLTGDTTDANTTFTVTVTVNGDPYTGSYTDASSTDHASSTGTFTLKQNESIVLKELHDGETVAVNETSIPFNYSYAKSTLGNADDTPVDNVSPKGYQYTVSENVDLKIWNSKNNYTYALTYAYTSYRSLYNTQKYKVNNSITDEDITKYFKEGSIVDSNNRTVTAYVFKDDAARAAFINHYAPFEDNYMTTLKWNTNMKSDTETTGVSIKYFSSSHEYWIDVNPIENQQKFVDFKMLLPYEHYDEPQQNYDPISDASGNVIYDETQLEISIDNLDYKSWFATNGVKKYGTSDGDPRFVTAPEKVIDNGTTKYFRYWSVRTIPNDTNPNYVEYTKCYSREFNLAIFQATQVEPIYTVLTAEEVSNGYTPNPHSEALKNANGATITFVENSRNQYNKNQSGDNIPTSRAEQGDRIFTDFLMSFANPEDIQYKTFADNTYTAGLLIERCAELDKDGEGKYYTKSEDQYQAQYGATISSALEATLKDYVDGARSNKAEKATDGYGYQYQKVEFDANKLDNKNRIEYYFSMAVRNHKGEFVDNGAKNYVYRAYSYIKDKDGNVKLFSAPLYFTIYDMASIANAEAVAP